MDVLERESDRTVVCQFKHYVEALCPEGGEDFYTLTLTYTSTGDIVDKDSFKEYLNKFSSEKIYAEDLVAEVVKDFPFNVDRVEVSEIEEMGIKVVYES